MKKGALWGLVGLSLGLILVAGCSNSTTTSRTGKLRIYLADSPLQYDEVNIVVTKVEVHSAGSDSLGGWAVVNNDTAIYNLLTLRNGANAILGDTMLPVGKYTQIRLYIGDSSNVIVGGVRYPLDVTADSIVKLNHEFDIAPGTLYLLTLDFDAARSIHQTGNGQYMLRPVIRVVANAISGSISGTVDPVSARAMASTLAETDTVDTFCDTTSGAFTLVALPAGSYDVTITPADTEAFYDTTIAGVQVIAQQNTNIGTVVLRPR
jgi:hypothetical protein